MSRSNPARRERAPDPQDPILPPPFGGYPYLISRIGRCALRHLALVPADRPRDRIVAMARAQAEANRFETAACFGPEDAVYVAFDNARTWDGPTPTGLIVIDRLRLPELLPETDELMARRARLRAFDRATRTGGYLVGDGTDRGERARPEDRARLGGRGPDGLPTGLRRCLHCGQAVGDYLRGGVEIVRVYCACENHNRCASCLTPLAAHRLSAWFWDDADGRAWHLAAYAAFSHRCPAKG
jgi:hypothetical protein